MVLDSMSSNIGDLALQILEAFIPILLNVNLSLNQTVLSFLLYVRQTVITQLILAVSLWGVYLPLNCKDSISHIHGLVVYLVHRTYL